MSIAARTPVETEHKSPSPRTPDIGGRPPIRHRTGGGGGGGDNEPDGGRGPQERLYRYRPGMFFFLAADAMFFSALVASFFVLQSSTHIDPRTQQFVNTWHAVPLPRILWWNTLVLMLSSVSMELARRHMFREVDVMDEWLGLGKPAARRAFPWVTLTFLLGVAFLTGQWIAWRELQARHLIFASNQSSHFFYLLTGLHAVHVLMGMVGLLAALIGLYAAARLETRQILVDLSAWYWHAMGIFWIFFFVLLVWFQ